MSVEAPTCPGEVTRVGQLDTWWGGAALRGFSGGKEMAIAALGRCPGPLQMPREVGGHSRRGRLQGGGCGQCFPKATEI